MAEPTSAENAAMVGSLSTEPSLKIRLMGMKTLYGGKALKRHE
jgi:hypothetical protein